MHGATRRLTVRMKTNYSFGQSSSAGKTFQRSVDKKLVALKALRYRKGYRAHLECWKSLLQPTGVLQTCHCGDSEEANRNCRTSLSKDSRCGLLLVRDVLMSCR